MFNDEKVLFNRKKVVDEELLDKIRQNAAKEKAEAEAKAQAQKDEAAIVAQKK